jgi:5-hydroxyisourate hydrolase-like protein (transthyretin family)
LGGRDVEVSLNLVLESRGVVVTEVGTYTKKRIDSLLTNRYGMCVKFYQVAFAKGKVYPNKDGKQT